MKHNKKSRNWIWFLFLRLKNLSCVCLSICLLVCVSIFLSVNVFVCLSVYLSVCLSICLSLCLSDRLSVCLSICLSTCLSYSLRIEKPSSFPHTLYVFNTIQYKINKKKNCTLIHSMIFFWSGYYLKLLNNWLNIPIY